MRKLIKRGWAESKPRGGWTRGSKLYRITDAGRGIIGVRRTHRHRRSHRVAGATWARRAHDQGPARVAIFNAIQMPYVALINTPENVAKHGLYEWEPLTWDRGRSPEARARWAWEAQRTEASARFLQAQTGWPYTRCLRLALEVVLSCPR